MKWIAYNIVPILLIFIVAGMIFKDKPNWGWILVAALLFTAFPSTPKNNQQ